MQGKILADSIIGGNDGNRYSFSIENISNLEHREMSDIINAEVDFEIDGEEAKSIYITKNPINVGNIMSGDSLSFIKTKAYIYMAGIFLGLIPMIGWIFSIVGFIFLILAVLGMARLSGAHLLRNLLLSWIIIFAGSWFLTLFAGLSLFNGSIDYAMLSIGMLIMIAGFVFAYFYYRDLSRVTNENFFFYAFICRVIAMFVILVPILGAVLQIATGIVELIAWIKFKEIRNKEEL